MADFAQVAPNIVYSRFSDYSENDFRPVTAKSYVTPTKSFEVVATAAASPYRVELGSFSAIDCLAITNENASNAVFADCFQLLSTVALTCTFTATTVTDDGATGVMISSGGYAGGTVRITNAVSNNGDYIITGITTNVITCAGATFTTDSSDSLNLQFLSHANLVVGPGETAVIYDVDPTQDVLLTGAGLARVRAFGT